jgi:hypothetical protein
MATKACAASSINELFNHTSRLGGLWHGNLLEGSANVAFLGNDLERIVTVFPPRNNKTKSLEAYFRIPLCPACRTPQKGAIR